MDQDVSLRSVVASLESQIAYHREQEALHAEHLLRRKEGAPPDHP